MLDANPKRERGMDAKRIVEAHPVLRSNVPPLPGDACQEARENSLFAVFGFGVASLSRLVSFRISIRSDESVLLYHLQKKCRTNRTGSTSIDRRRLTKIAGFVSCQPPK